MIEQEVIKCLERHGFKRKNNSWHRYEDAKKWVKQEVTINDYKEYDRAIKAITEYLNV